MIAYEGFEKPRHMFGKFMIQHQTETIEPVWKVERILIKLETKSTAANDSSSMTTNYG